MGYMRHHSIIVTSWNLEDVSMVHNRAKDIFGHLVSEIIDSRINGYNSFFIAPDGSQGGWIDSDEYDKKRNEIITLITRIRYDDGSSHFDWVEIQYGDEELETKIIRDSDTYCKKRLEEEKNSNV